MQWLNKFDDALESALQPRRRRHQQPNGGARPSNESPPAGDGGRLDEYEVEEEGEISTENQDLVTSSEAATPIHESDEDIRGGGAGATSSSSSPATPPIKSPPLLRSVASTPRSLPGSLVKKERAPKRSRASPLSSSSSSSLSAQSAPHHPSRPLPDQTPPPSLSLAAQLPPAASRDDDGSIVFARNDIITQPAASVAAPASATPRRGPPGRIRRVPTPKAAMATTLPARVSAAAPSKAYPEPQHTAKTNRAGAGGAVDDGKGDDENDNDGDVAVSPSASPLQHHSRGHGDVSLGTTPGNGGRSAAATSGECHEQISPSTTKSDPSQEEADDEMRDVYLRGDSSPSPSRGNEASTVPPQLRNRSATVEDNDDGEMDREHAQNERCDPSGVASAADRLQSPASGGVSVRSDQVLAAANGTNRRDASANLEDESTRSFPTSLPRQVEFKSEFDVGEVVQGWIPDGDGDEPFDAQRNCYGFFRVRPIRAQRLSCSVGTAVHAVVSLQPWDGKIRTRSTKAFAAERKRHGVCVQWEQHEGGEEEDARVDGDDLEQAPLVSMVHAYSGEETPVPRIRVDLIFKLVFEFTVATFEVPCQELMRVPNVPRRQWFAAVAGVKNQASDTTPLLELEAVFEPAETSSSNEQKLVPAESSIAAAKLVDDGIPVDSIEVGSVASSLQEELVTLPTPSFRASHHSHSKLAYNGMPRDENDGVSLSQHSIARGDGRSIATSPHMLRVTSHWTPAVCCVCKRSIMSGISKTKAYHCEVCRIDCCGDCRLQVDVQLPCGSDVAARARSEAIQNRFTVENIINTVAPPVVAKGDEDPSAEDDATSDLYETRRGTSLASLAVKAPTVTSSPIDDSGIGTMSLTFVRAQVFERPLSSDSDPDALKNDIPVKKGDYYIRVIPSSGAEAKRTRTMQNTGRPKFDSGVMKFSVPHYGAEFRVELVDASTNDPLGAGVITTQSLLLRQRDAFVEKHGLPILFPFRRPPSYDAQPILLELLAGVKSGADYFSVTKATSNATGNKAKGDIIGTIEMSARTDESFDNLFGQTPYECPDPPAAELNMSMFGMHLARLLGLVDDIRRMAEVYVYVISWRNPFITIGSLGLYAYACMKFDAEYLGNIPVAFLLVWMLHLALARWRGRLRTRLLDKEEEQLNKSLAVTIDRSLHRPAGKVTVAVKAGRNLRSADLGLPGLVGVRVLWDPTRYLSSNEQRTIARFDKTAGAFHEVGSTNYLYTTNPTFPRIDASDVSRRLKHLLPSDGDGGFFPNDTPSSEGTVTFPILQPVSLPRHGEIPAIDPWSDSPGAVVFEVNFQDTISLLPGSVYVLGEVAVPLANLTQHGEISGWFQVLEAGSTRIIALGEAGPDSSDIPQIQIRVAWAPPPNHPGGSNDTEREASFVIQEEMARSAVASKERKLGLIGSSMGAINTVRGLSDNLLLVQNALGLILDTLGSIRNAFNFTDPFRSSVLFWLVVALWFLLTVIPTRLLMLTFGVAQYVATFMSRFGHLLQRKSGYTKQTLDKSIEVATTESSPVVKWIVNAFRGLPTDEDVRKTYFWECRRHAVRKRSEAAETKRNARLQRLWRAQFYSTVTLFALKDDGRSESRSPVFCMIQGHRFLWWHTVEGFDAGEEPIGLIFLSGHAGLATPSPLELRHLEKSDLSRVVSIFGRGRSGQVRVTVIAPSDDMRTKLENAVSFATSEKRD